MSTIDLKSFTKAGLLFLSFVLVVLHAQHSKLANSDNDYAMPEPFSSTTGFTNRVFTRHDSEALLWRN